MVGSGLDYIRFCAEVFGVVFLLIHTNNEMFFLELESSDRQNCFCIVVVTTPIQAT